MMYRLDVMVYSPAIGNWIFLKKYFSRVEISSSTTEPLMIDIILSSKFCSMLRNL